MAVKCHIKDLNICKKKLDEIRKAPEAVLEHTVSDIKTRGPGWIADGVLERYALSGGKREAKQKITSGRIGTLRFRGNNIKKLQLVYKGRMLTPVHFGMNPTIRPDFGTPYSMRWRVTKGGDRLNTRVKKLTKKQKKNIGRNFTHKSTRTSFRSPWMLQPTGTKKEDGVPYIPFQRTPETNRKMSIVARAVSLPQMVTEGKDGPMHPEIATIFNEKLEKRFDHYVDRYLK